MKCSFEFVNVQRDEWIQHRRVYHFQSSRWTGRLFSRRSERLSHQIESLSSVSTLQVDVEITDKYDWYGIRFKFVKFFSIWPTSLGTISRKMQCKRLFELSYCTHWNQESFSVVNGCLNCANITHSVVPISYQSCLSVSRYICFFWWRKFPLTASPKTVSKNRKCLSE